MYRVGGLYRAVVSMVLLAKTISFSSIVPVIIVDLIEVTWIHWFGRQFESQGQDIQCVH